MRATSAMHTAALDPIAGCGLVLCPHEDDDLDLDEQTASLAATDFASLVSDLWHAGGWEPLDDEGQSPCDPYSGGVLVDSVRPDGRMLLSLWLREPVCGNPSVAELGASYAALREELWLLP